MKPPKGKAEKALNYLIGLAKKANPNVSAAKVRKILLQIILGEK
jgi:hypothetical protein